MEMNEYQEATSKTAIYPGHEEVGGSEAINYLIVSLCGEVGELANKWKKVMRDRYGIADLKFLEDAADELGDVLWYVAQLSQQLGCSLESLGKENIEKLRLRKERGVIKGSGDKR